MPLATTSYAGDSTPATRSRTVPPNAGPVVVAVYASASKVAATVIPLDGVNVCVSSAGTVPAIPIVSVVGLDTVTDAVAAESVTPVELGNR